MVTFESESNIYNLTFDQDSRELSYTAAGPTGTQSTHTVTIPHSLLDDPLQVMIDGESVAAEQADNSVSFAHEHTGRSQIIIRAK